MLLCAITAHLSQNIAAIPLLWIVPLAANLLSFILTFAGPRWYPRSFALRTLALAIVYLLLVGFIVALAFTLGSRIADEANSLAVRLPDLLRNREWIDKIPLPYWLEPARTRMVQWLQEEIEGLLIRQPYSAGDDTCNPAGVLSMRKYERYSHAIFARANHFRLHRDRSLRPVVGLFCPLQGHGDQRPRIPPFVRQQIKTRVTHVPDVAWLRNGAIPVKSNQPGLYMPLSPSPVL